MSVRNLMVGVLLLLTSQSYAQIDLNTLVSLNFSNVKAKVVFSEITKQTGYIFSYSQFNDDVKMSIKVNEAPIKNVISILEKELNVSIVVKQKYLILKAQIEKKPTEVIIEGTIYGESSNEPISDASVYVSQEKKLTNTNDQGYFYLKVPTKSKQVKVEIAKKNFIDTSLIVLVTKQQPISIKLKNYSRERISSFDTLRRSEVAVIPSSKPLFDSLQPLTFNDRFWEKQKEKNIDLDNITDTLFNGLSISLLPSISTNKLLSYHTKNNVAINVIGGHSKGSNGLEVAGVYNYNSGDVKGVQVAGVANRTYGHVIGTQVSGVMNTVNGYFDGVQVAGVANYSDSTVIGVQVAGVFQRAKRVDGVQVAGLYNIAKKLDGVQVSGLINDVDSSNFITQVAGFYNRAGDIKGVQVSGFGNKADTLQGLQIGIINKAKHIKSGFMLGLVNLAGNGFKRLELSYNELGTATIGFRSGWAPLHFHFFGGINASTKDKYYMQSGVGIASSIKMNSWMRLESDLNTRNNYDYNDIVNSGFSMQNQALLGLSFNAAKRFGIKTGLTLNHLWYDKSSSINNHIASTIDNTFYDVEGTSRNHRMWLGWHLGLVF